MGNQQNPEGIYRVPGDTRRFKQESDPPYHVINEITLKHIGPFSTESDAALAKYIGTEGWPKGRIMGKTEFDSWLERDK